MCVHPCLRRPTGYRASHWMDPDSSSRRDDLSTQRLGLCDQADSAAVPADRIFPRLHQDSRLRPFSPIFPGYCVQFFSQLTATTFSLLLPPPPAQLYLMDMADHIIRKTTSSQGPHLLADRIVWRSSRPPIWLTFTLWVALPRPPQSCASVQVPPYLRRG